MKRLLFIGLFGLGIPVLGKPVSADSSRTKGDTLEVSYIKVFFMDASVPDSSRKVTISYSQKSVILVNDYTKPATLEISKDMKQWSAFTIQASNVSIYPTNNAQLFVRLKTDPARSNKYTVRRGSRYRIYLGADGKLALNPED
ncbi:hypothetical protein GCM10028803_06500 [Larkinella knui]|uniref:Uncharacterized protein n=1 Tax=Larkinella knui TaxID=2025310 RepID=A0A3P1CK68_9BACT|nr:hypothetical protein [Larkinella knui]RRB13675.1 hypothetical protein EHT87_15560 [Larkinella knui]